MQPLFLTAGEITSWIGSFFWPLVRIAALLSVAPVIGGPQVPSRVRVGLAFLLTLSMMPLVAKVPQVDPLSIDAALIIVHQFLIGLSMGFMLLLVFNAVNLAGESIAITMGLGFALMSDPQNGAQVPVISQFYQVLATLLFLALNGHHAVIEMLAMSFRYVPIGESFSAERLWLLIEWSSVLFAGALKIALPAIAALLTVNMVMGVMTRAAPQLNIFSVGFPVTMTIGFVVILLTLHGFGTGFEQLLAETYLNMTAVLRGELP